MLFRVRNSIEKQEAAGSSQFELGILTGDDHLLVE
jgi:hypothetical protein